MTDSAIKGLGQLSLVARDLDRATVFYRDVVGLEHLFMAGGMSFFNVNGVRLMLGSPSRQFSHGSSILYYRVNDIQAEHARLADAGTGVLETPREVFRQQGHALWLAFYADTEGNVFALMEEKNDE